MTLKEYMRTHAGKYLVAETMRPVTVEDLDQTLIELEVEPYLLGEDASGRRRIHLYTRDAPHHLVTYIEQGLPADAASRLRRGR